MYFDVDGSETTDATKTGLPVITYVAAGTAARRRSTSTRRSTRSSASSVRTWSTNGGFGDFVPNGAFGGGWTTANVDCNGGWRGSAGTRARFILNYNGAAGTDPTIARRRPA